MIEMEQSKSKHKLGSFEAGAYICALTLERED